jgi:site-specific DNA-methyltransferase (adenine-specific)
MKIDLWQGDCLELMKDIPDGSVDFICADIPYGTTACKWDNVIPFEPMWEQLKRIIKDNGAICLFGSEPFSSALRMSNIKQFKYDWVWHKSKSGNIFQYKIMPMARTEIVSVFLQHGLNPKAFGYAKYYPELKECSKEVKTTPPKDGRSVTKRPAQVKLKKYTMKKTGYPENILRFKNEKNKLHPTQKPVALLEYLIKTYTLENETVLDFTMGSGSTGCAAKNLNRNFIGIELDENYFNIAKERINEN